MTWREFWFGLQRRPGESLPEFTGRLAKKTPGMVPPLSGAVHELALQVEALERRVAELEARER
jgi:hypothetical protein